MQRSQRQASQDTHQSSSPEQRVTRHLHTLSPATLDIILILPLVCTPEGSAAAGVAGRAFDSLSMVSCTVTDCATWKLKIDMFKWNILEPILNRYVGKSVVFSVDSKTFVAVDS